MSQSEYKVEAGARVNPFTAHHIVVSDPRGAAQLQMCIQIYFAATFLATEPQHMRSQTSCAFTMCLAVI